MISLHSSRSSRLRSRGFTLMESLVLIGIFIVLLSIFIPYLLSIRETNKRMGCEQNLRQIFQALQSYARDNGGAFPRVVYDPVNRPDGYTAFTGAFDSDPFAPKSTVAANDVTASLWLLVRGKYITDTRVFICPSSSDSRDSMTDDAGSPVYSPTQRSNFRSARNLSYSYANPFSSAQGYRLNDTMPAGFVVIADKNPGAAAATVGPQAPPLELSKANSPNHSGAGQHVVLSQGDFSFVKTPYFGIGKDNIYTARAASAALTTQPTTLPNNAAGVVGMLYSAVKTDDTYLVPTATDVWPVQMVPPSSMPTPGTLPAATNTTAAAATTAAAESSTATAPSSIPQ